jgi:hypothetical protein
MNLLGTARKRPGRNQCWKISLQPLCYLNESQSALISFGDTVVSRLLFARPRSVLCWVFLMNRDNLGDNTMGLKF